MSTQTETNGVDKSLTPMTLTGPFSTERYDSKDATAVGLPSPEGLNLLVTFAKQMVDTPFIPKALNTGPNRAGNILAVVLTGREEGFTPMEALRSYWISPDGRLAKYADALMAKMRRAGFKFPIKEFSDERAHLKAVRPDGEDYESTFTFAEAKRAKLTDKDIWVKYPQRMLKARVIGDVYRFLGADLGGPTYTAEELQDVESSTTAEPTDDDRKRFDQLAGGKYAPKEINPPSEPVIDVNPEVENAPPAKPVQQIMFQVRRRDATTGRLMEIPNELPFAYKEALTLRARSLANGANAVHVLVRLTEGKEPSEDDIEGVFNPPATAAPAPNVSAEPKEKSPAKTVIETLKGIATRIEQLTSVPEKTVRARITSFFVGYFGVPARELPVKGSADYLPAIDALNAILDKDPQVLLAEPQQAGERSRSKSAPVEKVNSEDARLIEYIQKRLDWKDDLAGMALATAKAWGLGAVQFEQFVNANELDFKGTEDVSAYFYIAAANRDAGGKLLLNCKKHNLSMGAAVKQMAAKAGLSPQSTPEEVGGMVNAWVEEVRNAIAKPAPAPEDDGSAGTFWD